MQPPPAKHAGTAKIDDPVDPPRAPGRSDETGGTVPPDEAAGARIGSIGARVRDAVRARAKGAVVARIKRIAWPIGIALFVLPVLLWWLARWAWRGRATRAILIAAGALLLCAGTVHLLALAALRDIALAARDARLDPPTPFPQPARLLLADETRLRLTGAGDPLAAANLHAAPLADAASDGAGTLVRSADHTGMAIETALVNTRGAVPRLAAALGALHAFGTRWLWTPVGLPVSRAALAFALRFEALSVPVAARGAIRGSFGDCASCARLVELGPGWAIAAPGGRRRLLRQERTVAIALAAPDDALWRACAAQEACPAASRPIGALAAFLQSATGRAYRAATADEIAYASATLWAGAGPAWRDGDAARLASDDPGTAVPLGRVYPGPARRTDLLVAACSAGHSLDVRRVASALAASGRWGKVGEADHVLPVAVDSPATIVVDEGTGEAAKAAPELAAALVAQGFAAREVRLTGNTGPSTPWYLTVILCGSRDANP